jgi:hypothetical protein
MTHRNVLSSDAGGRLPRTRTSLPRRSLAGLAVASAVTVVLGACAGPGSGPSQGTLAGSATDEESTTSDGSAGELQIDPGPTDGKTPSGGPPWDRQATEACEAVVGGGGLAQVAQSPDDAGTITFWTKGRQWAACDVAAGAEGVEPAVLESTRRGRPGFDERSLAVTTTVLPGPDGSPAAVRLVAGGRLPWRVDEISYTFPDGHTEQARFVTSEDDPGEVWWSVTYTPTAGVLVDPDTEAADLGPVTVSIVGAAAEAFRLPWEDAQRSE